LMLKVDRRKKLKRNTVDLEGGMGQQSRLDVERNLLGHVDLLARTWNGAVTGEILAITEGHSSVLGHSTEML
jgi:hypothetical protein